MSWSTDSGGASTIGPSGGSLTVGSLTLDVPAGAVAADTAITITEAGTAVPDGYVAVTPLYRFAPEGLVFAMPIAVKMSFQGLSAGLRIYWSRTTDPTSYEPLATEFADGVATAHVTHFSTGFLGRPRDQQIGNDAVAAVTFTPNPGTYASPLDVTLATATIGATIHFSVDGTEPTTSSSAYSGAPIRISTTTTVKAMATHEGAANSAVSSATYSITPPPLVAPVSFNPGSSSFITNVSVSLATSTIGATIHYTLDGTDPTMASAVYTEPIVVSASSTIRALATLAGAEDSPITSATYTKELPTVAPVTIVPGDGVYANPQDVVLSTTTSGATISYTLDGSDPTSSIKTYTFPLLVGSTTTVRAIARRAGFLSSPITQATLTISTPPSQVKPVTFEPPSATYDNPVPVGLATATPGATIHYTLDGSTPTTASPQYSAGSPIPIDGPTTTIKAFATHAGDTDSVVTSATYAFKVANVVFTPNPGPLAVPAFVYLTTTTSATPTAFVKIYYTLDGSTPTIASTKYTGPIQLLASTTIRALAVRSGYADSDVSTGAYTAP